MSGDVVYIDCSPFMGRLLEEAMPDWRQRMLVHIGDPGPDAVVDLAAHAEVILNGHTMMDDELLGRLPQLRRIIFLGSGASSYIDVRAAAERGIKVETISGYGDRSVAEHAAALMFAAARKVAAMDRDLRAGHWEPLEGAELLGRQLGIIGFGGIGRSFAEIAKALGMKVAIWNRNPVAAEWRDYAMPLDELLAGSDVVSLHLALTEETRGMIGDAEIERMKSGAILINTARGGLVDADALLAALAAGKLGHVGLDVFDEEPLPAGSVWTTLPNVTLTAHAGFKTQDAARRLVSQALDLVFD
ncbi:2-hydroxyacid dehydrogenase [Amorphus sp. 3PC139-8]|uniref:2-hydroxyacid dehydrogenase n=1 Tax=Amorphus sp. 3PC139-8 TaxID=2735676 RepID=UPI00345D761A